jgi:thiamine pyrophosphokinase
VLEHWLREAEIFICADAAGYPYDRLPRRPDLIIGDFDTLARKGVAGWSVNGETEIDGLRHIHQAEQASTDSEKALLWALTNFHAEGVLLGATGGRLDHSLFNVSLLERFAGRMPLCIADELSVCIRLAPGSFTHWPLAEGTGFSLVPLAGPAQEVTLTGAAYPLHDARLAPGGPATVSNHVKTGPLSIRVGSGSLMLSVSLLEPRNRGGA